MQILHVPMFARLLLRPRQALLRLLSGHAPPLRSGSSSFTPPLPQRALR
jgi:hypothetical protein